MNLIKAARRELNSAVRCMENGAMICARIHLRKAVAFLESAIADAKVNL